MSRVMGQLDGIRTRPPHESRPVPPLHLTGLAACFALGIAAGWHAPPALWPWLALAVAFTVAGLLLRRTRLALLAMGAAFAAFGAAWVILQHHHVSEHDLSAMLGDEPQNIRVEGVATRGPELRRRVGGSLAVFDYRPPATYFPMRVDALIDRVGERIDVTGRMYVRIDGPIAPFRAGDRVKVTGRLVPLQPARNPGEFDTQAYGRTLGQAGLLIVPDRRLIEITPASRSGIVNAWLDFRDSLQRRAGGVLLANLPEGESTHRDALLSALLLGQREPELDGLNESFQRVGLAHLLAISGLHLGIMAGMVLLLVRFGGHYRPWHGWLVLVLVLMYLVLVEVRLPVLRAGVMTMAACLGLALGRTFHVGGLIALSAIGLLLWRPDQLFTPGFQLSFGVVLGLIHLQPVLRDRWFGPPDMEVASSAQMLGQWLYSALATAVAAWLVATPIVLFHFGMAAPLGIPLSVVGVPLVAFVLALGYAKMLVALVLPSAAIILGVPLAVSAETMVAMVLAFDSLPGSTWNLPFPSVAWTIAALMFVWAWARPAGLTRKQVAAASFVIVIWLFWPWLPLHAQPAMRIDMLAVGDGSCFIVRSGNRTMVFDAGSNSSMDAGRRWVVPAMRRLNVRSIDFIAISHPDIDHYSAVLEIVDEFHVGRVLITPQFAAHVASVPDGPVALVAEGLAQRRVMMEEVTDGHVEHLGDAELTWLHPRHNFEEYGRENDHSMVVRIDAAGRTALLTGDVEREGIARMLPRSSQLRADIVELPHHGSYNDMADALIRQLQPQVVLQSTGYMRWSRDRWAGQFADMHRFVTVRDGACWVEVDHEGNITSGRFVDRDGPSLQDEP